MSDVQSTRWSVLRTRLANIVRVVLIVALGGQLQRKTISHRLHDGQTGLTPHLASIGG